MIEENDGAIDEVEEEVKEEEVEEVQEAVEIEGEAMEPKVVKVFHSTYCESCHEIVEMIEGGKYVLDIEGAEVEVVNVTSEEGFPELAKEDVDAIPSAKFEGKTCRLSINREEGVVLIDCKDPEVGDEEPGSEELGEV